MNTHNPDQGRLANVDLKNWGDDCVHFGALQTPYEQLTLYVAFNSS